jgi:hypothetical protein
LIINNPFPAPEKILQNVISAAFRKNHTGHRQQLLEPTDTKEIKPEACDCGNRKFSRLEPFYAHQHIV